MAAQLMSLGWISNVRAPFIRKDEEYRITGFASIRREPRATPRLSTGRHCRLSRILGVGSSCGVGVIVINGPGDATTIGRYALMARYYATWS